MKKVVLVNQSTGYLMIDIANAFTGKYDEVCLIAGSVKVMQRSLNTKVKLKTITYYNRTSTISRLYSWLAGSIQIWALLLVKYHNYDLVFFTNPPFAYLSALHLRRKFNVVVYDTYPDALKNIGVSPSSVVYRVWAQLNKKVFKKAMNIITLSDSMKSLLEQYVTSEKIIVIPNWSGSDSFKPIHKTENLFIKEQGLQDQFVVLYSGNIGYTHNVEIMIAVAKQLQQQLDICFLFIGEGKKKQELLDQVEKYKLTNCKFLTWQDSSILPLSLASADLGVVTLNDESGMLSVPSKTYNLLACGVPLLSISPELSELATLITNFQNGRNFSTNEVNDIAKFILKCRDNKEFLAQLSANSLAASQHFNHSNAELYVIE